MIMKRCLGFCGKLIPFNPKRPGQRLCAKCRETKTKHLLTMSRNEKYADQMKVIE